MNKKTKVLVVDDSVVIRRLLCEVISSDPQMEVVGYAANGQIAMAKLDQLSPDIITLDIEMPVMNGLETLKAIRAKHRRLPVIMFSTLTERGAAATIDSLSFGASDYVTKPANVGSFGESKEQIRLVLIPKIKALCGVGSAEGPRYTPNIFPKPPNSKTRSSGRIDVVAIGCSTGGPNALADILPSIPFNFPVPILIVQHMPPAFTRFLAQRLDKFSGLRVQEAVAGSVIEPGTAWIAPGDFHMTAVRERDIVRIATNQNNPENSCRPSVDVLFRSVAEAYNSNVLTVVLTGMGQDGLKGCERLADGGAQIVVQDEATSIVWGMPGFIAKAGLANAVLPLEQLAPEIVRRVNASKHTPRTLGVS
jgi:two-component system chemotaxis response regulator CheB